MHHFGAWAAATLLTLLTQAGMDCCHMVPITFTLKKVRTLQDFPISCLWVDWDLPNLVLDFSVLTLFSDLAWSGCRFTFSSHSSKHRHCHPFSKLWDRCVYTTFGAMHHFGALGSSHSSHTSHHRQAWIVATLSLSISASKRSKLCRISKFLVYGLTGICRTWCWIFLI